MTAITFNETGTIVAFTVPATGEYDISATGATGGSAGSSNPGGDGAEVSGTFALTAGDVIEILVGGVGGSVPTGGAGGGGGSFVYDETTSTLLVGAGGGGGGGGEGGGGSPGSAGGPGLAGTAGGTGGEYFNGYGLYPGGVGGNGGAGGAAGEAYDGTVGEGSAGAGGGFSGPGATGDAGTGGASFLAGGAAGGRGALFNGVTGGFGGGGGGSGSNDIAGGGGGGYSGGGAGEGDIGGGGGSYIEASASAVSIEGGVNATGNGTVVIAPVYVDVFEQNVAATAGSEAGWYLWSNPANWSTGAVPVNGDSVSTSQIGVDNLPALTLVSLTETALSSALFVASGALSVGSFIYSGAVAGYPAVEADGFDFDPTATTPITFTVGTVSAPGVEFLAVGATSVIIDNAASDAGGSYDAGVGGTIRFAAVPAATSYVSFGGGITGTIELQGLTAGAYAFNFGTITPGDVLELPVATVTGVTYGSTSLTIDTNAGTYSFSNASYAWAPLNGFTASPDTGTGLEAITFTETDIFEQNVAATSGPLSGDYLWSNPANWSTGAIPVDGDSVEAPQSGIDDLTALTLTSLTESNGAQVWDVDGILNIGTLVNQGGELYANNFAYPTTPVTVTVGAISGGGGDYRAIGATSEFIDNAASDPGASYTATDGGTFLLAAAPADSSALAFDAGPGTIDLAGLTTGAYSTSLEDVAPGDVLEVPAGAIDGVNFGASSLGIVTTAGSYDFSNVSTTSPVASYTAGVDSVTNLEAISFVGPLDSFEQNVATNTNEAGGFGDFYLWSTPANWSTGAVPVDGGSVSVSGVSIGYDDLAALTLSTLTLNTGAAVVVDDGHLNIGTLVDTGGEYTQLDAEGGGLAPTTPGTITIGAITGAGGAYYATNGARLIDNAVSDPGALYSAASGGTVLLKAAPATTSELQFYHNTLGTIALAGLTAGTYQASLENVAPGDVLEVPAGTISAVSFGANSMTIAAAAGTYTFSDVSYATVNGYSTVTGYTASPDPVTGLEAITFTNIPDVFEANVAAYGGPLSGWCLWSNPANWSTGVVPVNGDSVSTSFDGVDDLAALTLTSLTETASGAAVLVDMGTLDIGSLVDNAGSPPEVAADDVGLTTTPIIVTVGTVIGSGGLDAAEGQGPLAKFVDNATYDPGETYAVGSGGTVVLAASPSASSDLLFFTNEPGGTIALAGLGAGTYAGTLSGLQPGDVLELPVSAVTSASFGGTSLSLDTNAGTYNFDNANYYNPVTGYTASPDSATGLEAITLTGTVTFQESVPQTTGPLAGDYLWSNAANWSNGAVPVNGDSVVDSAGGIDDLPALSLNTLTVNTLTVGQDDDVQVTGGTLAIGTLASSGPPGSFSIVEADSVFGTPVAITVSNVTGTGIDEVAYGATGRFVDNATSDPGETYVALAGGTVVLAAPPSPNSDLQFSNSGDLGTIALAGLGAGTYTGRLYELQLGDVLELPVSAVTGAAFGGNSGSGYNLSLDTSAGSYNFSNLGYAPIPANSVTAGLDPVTGLEAVTFIDTTIVNAGSAATSPSIPQYNDLSIQSGATVSDPVIAGGTLDLGTGSTLSGDVTFSGSDGRVIIDAGTAVTNTIVNFGSGDSIQLQGVPYAAGDTVEVLTPGTVTIVTTANGDFNFNVAGATPGEAGFSLSSDLVLTATGATTLPPRTLVWTGAGGANFANATNWDDTTLGLDPATAPPSVEDTVEFDSSGGNITGTGTAAALSFEAGSWHLATGGSLTATGGVVVGTSLDATLLIDGGSSLIESTGAVIASGSGASGSSVNVNGIGSNWQVGGTLVVGNAGFGDLSLSQGASVTAGSLDTGAASGGDGIVSIVGTNTALNLTGNLTVGDQSTGELTILSGAKVSGANGNFGGSSAASPSSVDIEGAGSQLTLSGTLAVGENGPAVFTLGQNTVLDLGGNLITGIDGTFNQSGTVDPPNVLNDGVTNLTGGAATLADISVENSGEYTVKNGPVSIYTPLVTDDPNPVTDLGSTTGLWQIDTLGTLVLNTTSVDASQTIQFNALNGVLVIGQQPDIGLGGTVTGTVSPGDPNVLPGFDAPIQNFKAGDEILFTGLVYGSDTQVANTVTLWSGAAGTGTDLGSLSFITLSGGPSTSEAVLAAAQIESNATALCFLAGTLIQTPSGEREVERLAVGDSVVTASGVVRPIEWIGVGKVLATRGRRGAATPVIVRKGALGANVPYADLRVTKGHSLLLDGVLIPVEFLVNHRSILWDDRAQEVSIYHVELATHDVLVANGAAAESYRDDGNRWLFQNGNAGWGEPPKEPCAPVLTGGPVVDAVWRRLLDAAGPRPSVPLTEDPDIHLLVDGVRVDPTQQSGDVLVFTLPTRSETVRIVSRAAVPAELGLARDPRTLGVSLKRIVVRQGTRFRTVKATDPRLVSGFHAFEGDTGVRWTDGDALLVAELLGGFSGPVEVVLHLGGTAHYIDDGSHVGQINGPKIGRTA